jgi:enoyl-CoA hydratase
MEIKMEYGTISYQVADGIARIAQNRPDRSNAQSAPLLDDLDHAMSQAVADPEVRVIILSGNGKHFSAGHDLHDEIMLEGQKSPEARYEFESKRYLEYCLRIFDAPKPTIAQVHGACIAGAFMVANMCDLIIASEDAFFADPVVGAFGAAAVEVLVHPWVMGLRQAKQFLFTGGRMTAVEAHHIGMVNEVVAREQLEERTEELARQIAKAQPFALRLIKRSLNRTADIQGFRAALDAHFDTHQLSHMGTEAQAVAASGVANRISGIKAGIA